MELPVIMLTTILTLLFVLMMIIFNRLVALKQTRKKAFSDIDVQLNLRHDLVPNLVEVVSKYAEHEKEVFENVTEARSRSLGAETVEEKGIAGSLLGGALGNLLAVAENYPDLGADNVFVDLQNKLTNTEQKIAASRRYFNNSTAEYNTVREQFPANLMAKVFRFQGEDYFELDEDKKQELEEPLKVAI